MTMFSVLSSSNVKMLRMYQSRVRALEELNCLQGWIAFNVSGLACRVSSPIGWPLSSLHTLGIGA